MSYFSRYIRLPERPEAIQYAAFTTELHTFESDEDFQTFLLNQAEKVIYYTTPGDQRFHWAGEAPFSHLIPSLPNHQEGITIRRLSTTLFWLIKRLVKELSNPIHFLVLGFTIFTISQWWDDGQFLGVQDLSSIIFFVIALRFLYNWIRQQSILLTHRGSALHNLKAYHQFHIWMGTTRITGIYIMPIILVALYVSQLIYGFEASVQDYGLVKSAVREQNEYFRLFTSTLLHGSILHIFFNASALMALSGLMLRFVSWAWVFGTYLLSALAGSLASLWLLPEGTSVGASGAILGIFGFVVVLGLRFRHIFPFSFTLNSLFDVAFIAMYGLLGSTIIDNAAHAGGFLMGALLALAVRESTLIQRIDVLSQPFRDSQGGTLQAEAQASQPAGNT